MVVFLFNCKHNLYFTLYKRKENTIFIHNNRGDECLKSFGNPRTIITNKSKKILSLLFHFL